MKLLEMEEKIIINNEEKKIEINCIYKNSEKIKIFGNSFVKYYLKKCKMKIEDTNK